MATVAANHVVVAMGQVETTSLPRPIHSFLPTTFFLVTMSRCYFFSLNEICIKHHLSVCLIVVFIQ